MINKKYLPSKNFIITVIVAVCIILITIILNYWKPSITKYKNSNVATELYASSSLLSNVDTDEDGLPDWLENLYGTDPKKIDTDGDGTSDTEEVKLNRDPLKANTAKAEQEPNDKIAQAEIEQDQKIAEEYEKLTTTEKMARNLMSNILASQPTNGQQIDESTINALVQRSLQDIPTLEYQGITKESDLNMIKFDQIPSEKDIYTYKMGYYAQTVNFLKILGQDIVIINKYISTKDIKTKLGTITSQFQTIINNLIKLPVPAIPDSAVMKLHLGLINDLEKIIQIDNDIVNSYNKDTARVFSDLSVYNNNIQELGLIIKGMDTILKIKR